MIRVHRPLLSQLLTPAERRRFARKQAPANDYARQDSRIDPVWRNFRRSRTGKALYRVLAAVFHSKCAFCERPNAKTADHFYPRKRYPKRMFRWRNLLLCCAECNFAKGAHFPFANRRPQLIDPTREDPSAFFTWDFETGAMLESADPLCGPRAIATRNRLKLDDGPLKEERRMQLKRVLRLLKIVIVEYPDIRPETRQWLTEELHADRPYLAIVRFLFQGRHEFREIVDDARAKLPDIDAWTAAWL